MKTAMIAAMLAVLANLSCAAGAPAFVQLKNNIPALEVPVPGLRLEPAETPAALRADLFDQAAFLAALAHALGEADVVRAPWAMDDISLPRGRVLTAEQAQQLADRLRAGRQVPFNYIKDGCAARAHLVCEALRKEGIACAKIFADSGSDSGGSSFRAHGELMIADWPWHVAPLIYVRHEITGKVDVRVLDLGLARQPLPVAEWIGLFRNRSAVTVDLTDDAQYAPRKSANEERKTFESALPEARATSADAGRFLETAFLDGPGNTEAAVPGPFAAKVADSLQWSLSHDRVIQNERYRPFFRDPEVTEVLGRPRNGRRAAKLRLAYTMPSAGIAGEIADSFGPDSMEAENLLTDTVTLPEGSENITATAYGRQVIFFVYYELPQP